MGGQVDRISERLFCGHFTCFIDSETNEDAIYIMPPGAGRDLQNGFSAFIH